LLFLIYLNDLPPTKKYFIRAHFIRWWH
jgi:hypothetical protein